MRLGASLLITLILFGAAGSCGAADAPLACRTALAKLTRTPGASSYSYQLRAPGGEILLLPENLETADVGLFETLKRLFGRGDGPVHGNFTFCQKGVVSYTYAGKPIYFGTIEAFSPVTPQ
jgi:hypothetical protein